MQVAATAGGLGCPAAALRRVRFVLAAARMVLRRSNENRLASNLALGKRAKAIDPRRRTEHAQAAHAGHQESPQYEAVKHRPLFYGAMRGPANTRRPEDIHGSRLIRRPSLIVQQFHENSPNGRFHLENSSVVPAGRSVQIVDELGQSDDWGGRLTTKSHAFAHGDIDLWGRDTHP